MAEKQYQGARVFFEAAIFSLILPLFLFLGSASAAEATIYLSDTGWSQPVGTWDPATRTGTLTQDATEPIEIVSDGIALDGNIHAVTGFGTGSGVYLSGRTGVTIKNLIVKQFRYGIHLSRSASNILSGNTANSNKWYGIYLDSSNNNLLTGNTASNNSRGIGLFYSTGNMLTGNATSNNSDGIYLDRSSNNTLCDNTASDYGGGICVLYSSNNNLVARNSASNNHWGIWLSNSSNNTLIDNSTTWSKDYGIELSNYSNNNTLAGNTANSNKLYGISLSYSTNNTLSGNTASNNGSGIYLAYSTGNTLGGNAARNNGSGIDFYGSTNNTLMNNTASNNSRGVYFRYSSYNTLSGNAASNNGIGMSLYSSPGSVLTGNRASNSGVGILLDSSHNSMLTGNTVSDNDYGIAVFRCDGNHVYRNNFVNNATQAYVMGGSGNSFNLDAPVGGNHWSDWTTPDSDNDGFVDSPYVFIGGVDYLPWAKPVLPADSTPPTTTLAASPGAPNGLNDWYVSSPIITFAAVDDEGGSGVVKTYYHWDGQADQEYAVPLSAPEGIHTLYYHSVDTAGNVEAERSQQFKVDTIAPTPPAILEPANGSSVDNPLTIRGSAEGLSTVRAQDGGSLIATLQAGLDGNWATDALTLAEGPHTLTATATDEAGNTSTPSAPVQIMVRYATTLGFNPECSTSGQFSDGALLSATLTSSLGPVPFRQVAFFLGAQTYLAVTDETGVARLAILLDQMPGSYVLAVSFAGDETYRGTSASQPFTIAKEDTALTYSGDQIQAAGGTAHLAGRLSDADTNIGIANRTVAFRLGSQTIDAQTNQDGVAEAYLLITQPQGLYTISAGFAGDAYYLASTSPASEFIIYDPFSGMKVTAGGWVVSNGGKANFGFNGAYEAGLSVPTGQFQYVDHGGGPKIHAAALDWVVFVDNRAIFAGSCTVNGVTGYKLRVEAADGGEPGGGTDSFKITVQDPSGTQFYSAGGALTKGNIQIHKK